MRKNRTQPSSTHLVLPYISCILFSAFSSVLGILRHNIIFFAFYKFVKHFEALTSPVPSHLFQKKYLTLKQCSNPAFYIYGYFLSVGQDSWKYRFTLLFKTHVFVSAVHYIARRFESVWKKCRPDIHREKFP